MAADPAALYLYLSRKLKAGKRAAGRATAGCGRTPRTRSDVGWTSRTGRTPPCDRAASRYGRVGQRASGPAPHPLLQAWRRESILAQARHSTLYMHSIPRRRPAGDPNSIGDVSDRTYYYLSVRKKAGVRTARLNPDIHERVPGPVCRRTAVHVPTYSRVYRQRGTYAYASRCEEAQRSALSGAIGSDRGAVAGGRSMYVYTTCLARVLAI